MGFIHESLHLLTNLWTMTNVDADAQPRRKMFLKVIDDVMEQCEEIMKLPHLM